MRRDLPSGVVTFLFTDIEGSTKLLHELGAETYSGVLAEHRRVLREAFAAHNGVEVDTQGDAFFVAFPTAPDAVQAAWQAQGALAAGPVRVRVGIHTGMPHVSEEGYVGEDVHKGARIAAAGHGGQVLLSSETQALISIEVTDLGEHRLKDFSEPIGIFQLGSERFPPVKTISNTNLPRPASSFIGRGEEVERVVGLLRNGVRLLTLTGPGGSGKTRLSIEVAVELVPQFRNGVFWVGLAPVRDPALVTETIGQTLGAKDGLAQHIAAREMLLVIDNLEQVVSAAPELASLVEACPNLKLLVTSRELLRVRGEVEYPVLPLAEPDAVDLFCARSGLDEEAAIVELCRRLDKLPLAVELAAARTKVLSPAQILERLSERLDLLKGGRDADARQRTLRATIEWSYELLSSKEQALFARQGVFAGCTLDAAEAIAGADLDTLESLVDKSLVRHSGDRFWMLETIRAYAMDRLEHTGDGARIRQRHSQYYLALAEQDAPYITGVAEREWLDRQENDHDNHRAAYDWFASSGHTQDVLRLVGALTEFWQLRGHLAEAARRFDAALDADDSPTPARAQALQGATDIASSMSGSDIAVEKRRNEEALSINRRLGNRRGIANSLWSVATTAIDEGDLAGAQRNLEESIAIYREIGDEHYLLHVSRTLAWTYELLGDLERARAMHEETLRRARALDNRYALANTLGSLAGIAVDQRRIQDAVSFLREGDAILKDVRDLRGMLENLSRMAGLLAFAERPALAAQILGSLEVLSEEAGGASGWARKLNEETLTTIHKQLDDQTFAEAWAMGRRLSAEQAMALGFDSGL